MSHGKILCRSCEKIMSQCRCMNSNKSITYDVCDECLSAGKSAAQALKDIYDESLKALQKKCLHKKTEFMEEHFAPGHSTGVTVEVCDECWKIIKKVVPNKNQGFPPDTRYC